MLTVDISLFNGLSDNQCGVLATSLITGTSIENVIFLEGQQVGDAVDTLTKGCWLLDGKQIDQVRNESKHDKASQIYGNFFVEFEQTFNNWITRQRSGLPLAAEQADIFTSICYGHQGAKVYIFTFNPKKLYSELLKADFPHAPTKPRKNGNKPGSFARGWRVPFREISGFYPMMVDKYGSFDNFYELTKVKVQKL